MAGLTPKQKACQNAFFSISRFIIRRIYGMPDDEKLVKFRLSFFPLTNLLVIFIPTCKTNRSFRLVKIVTPHSHEKNTYLGYMLNKFDWTSIFTQPFKRYQ